MTTPSTPIGTPAPEPEDPARNDATGEDSVPTDTSPKEPVLDLAFIVRALGARPVATVRPDSRGFPSMDPNRMLQLLRNPLPSPKEPPSGPNDPREVPPDA